MAAEDFDAADDLLIVRFDPGNLGQGIVDRDVAEGFVVKEGRDAATAAEFGLDPEDEMTGAARSAGLVSTLASISRSTRRSVGRPRRKSNISPCQSAFTVFDAWAKP